VCSGYVVCVVDMLCVQWICCVCSGYVMCAVDKFVFIGYFVCVVDMLRV